MRSRRIHESQLGRWIALASLVASAAPTCKPRRPVEQTTVSATLDMDRSNCDPEGALEPWDILVQRHSLQPEVEDLILEGFAGPDTLRRIVGSDVEFKGRIVVGQSEPPQDADLPRSQPAVQPWIAYWSSADRILRLRTETKSGSQQDMLFLTVEDIDVRRMFFDTSTVWILTGQDDSLEWLFIDLEALANDPSLLNIARELIKIRHRSVQREKTSHRGTWGTQARWSTQLLGQAVRLTNSGHGILLQERGRRILDGIPPQDPSAAAKVVARTMPAGNLGGLVYMRADSGAPFALSPGALVKALQGSTPYYTGSQTTNWNAKPPPTIIDVPEDRRGLLRIYRRVSSLTLDGQSTPPQTTPSQVAQEAKDGYVLLKELVFASPITDTGLYGTHSDPRIWVTTTGRGSRVFHTIRLDLLLKAIKVAEVKLPPGSGAPPIALQPIAGRGCGMRLFAGGPGRTLAYWDLDDPRRIAPKEDATSSIQTPLTADLGSGHTGLIRDLVPGDQGEMAVLGDDPAVILRASATPPFVAATLSPTGQGVQAGTFLGNNFKMMALLPSFNSDVTRPPYGAVVVPVGKAEAQAETGDEPPPNFEVSLRDYAQGVGGKRPLVVAPVTSIATLPSRLSVLLGHAQGIQEILAEQTHKPGSPWVPGVWRPDSNLDPSRLLPVIALDGPKTGEYLFLAATPGYVVRKGCSAQDCTPKAVPSHLATDVALVDLKVGPVDGGLVDLKVLPPMPEGSFGTKGCGQSLLPFVVAHDAGGLTLGSAGFENRCPKFLPIRLPGQGGTQRHLDARAGYAVTSTEDGSILLWHIGLTMKETQQNVDLRPLIPSP